MPDDDQMTRNRYGQIWPDMARYGQICRYGQIFEMFCLKCGDDHVNHVWEPLKDAKGPFQGHPGGYLMISSIPVTKCEEVGVGEGWTVTRIELQRLLRTAWGFHGVKVFFSATHC